MTTDNSPLEKSSSSGNVLVKVDGWGTLGPKLSEYHFSDIIGIIGLLISVFTLYQAASAKTAARAAAETAIRFRDALEIASKLAELASSLRTIRDLYLADSPLLLEHLKDRTIGISVSVKTMMDTDEEAQELMEQIEIHLRSDVRIHKDEVKRKSQLERLAGKTIRLADKVESLKAKRLTDGI